MNREKRYWLDQPGNITKIVNGIYAICAILLLADLLYPRHGHFGFEEWFGFYAFFGFTAYCFIVNSAKLLRLIVKRDENYYGESDTETLNLGDGHD